MRIAVLSRSAEQPATARLVTRGRELGHTMEVVVPLECGLAIGCAGPGLSVSGREAPRFDAVVPRIGACFPSLALAVLRSFERDGIPALNSSAAIVASRDKLRALELLDAAGLPVPATMYVKDLEQLRAAIDRVGGAPVVVKPREGSQGRRVVRADSLESAHSILEAFTFLSQDVIVQEYIAEADGSDLRILVLGDRTIAAVRRRAPAGCFRANLHQGGTAAMLHPEPALSELALRAARATGLEFAGVDLLESARGPLLLEVNPSPGLEGVEGATGVDVAGEILRYLERRQRATRPGARAASAAGEAPGAGWGGERGPEL